MELKLRHQLKKLLDDHGITAAELSRRTGISKQSISDWMAGVSPKSIENLRIIARTLGTTIDDLCFGEVSRATSEIKAQIRDGSGKDLSGIYRIEIKRIQD